MNSGAPGPRVAIACPGVGLVQRGYERMFRDLFEQMKNGEVDATLFQGGGATSAREKVPLFIHRNSALLKALPLHTLVGRTPMHVECLTFAFGLLPHLRGGRYDVVHTIDPPLARILYKVRGRLGMRFRLLFTHGCSMPPGHYPPADHLQEVARVPYDDALAAGIRPDALTLLPPGFEPARFAVSKDRSELRREYGVPEDAFVILSIAALSRRHKRTDHLIEEAARLDGNFVLWLDGSLDHGEPDLIGYARSRLGERCRVTHVASDKVGELHRMADVMANASLFEAFGLAVVEAASSGAALLVHDAPHFRWLVENPATWVDMATPGTLAARLARLMRNPRELDGMRYSEGSRRRFAWEVLRGEYRKLYHRVAAISIPERGTANPNYYRELHG